MQSGGGTLIPGSKVIQDQQGRGILNPTKKMRLKVNIRRGYDQV